MPRKPPTTKRGKRAKMATVMREFYHGDLRSGSGRKVTSPAQAKAIGMHVSGQSRLKRQGRKSRRSRR